MTIHIKSTAFGVTVALLAAGGAALAADPVVSSPVMAKQITAVASTAPKAITFDPATYTGETGKIALPIACKSALLLRKFEDGKLGDYLTFSSSDKTLLCPVGTYKIMSCSLRLTDKYKQNWSVDTRFVSDERRQAIEVKSGQETEIEYLTKIVSAIQSGEFGKVALPYPATFSVQLSPADAIDSPFNLSVTSAGKNLLLPVGNYKVISYSANVKKHSAEWQISSPYMQPKDAQSVFVKAGEEAKLPIYGNLAAKVIANKTGKIVLPGAGESTVMLSLTDGKPGDSMQIKGKNKVLEAPAGSYNLGYCSLNLTDKFGQKWTLNSRFNPAEAQTLVVPADGSVSLGKADEFSSAISSGKIGKISLPYAGNCNVQLATIDSGKPGFYLSLSSKDKTLKVPAGKYQVDYYSVSASDKYKNTWQINYRPSSDAAKTVEVKPDSEVNIGSGGQLAASLENGQTGDLTLPYTAQATLALTEIVNGQPGDSVSLNTKGNVLAVPAAKYKVGSYYTTVTDAAGAKWSLSLSPSAKNSEIEIKSGTSTNLATVEPLEASVIAKQDGDKIVLNLQMLTQNGDRCTLRPSDSSIKAPGFEVLSKSGEVLLSGNFAYG